MDTFKKDIIIFLEVGKALLPPLELQKFIDQVDYVPPGGAGCLLVRW